MWVLASFHFEQYLVADGPTSRPVVLLAIKKQ